MFKPEIFAVFDSFEEYILVKTVGAPHICVIDSLEIRLNISFGSAFRKHICVPPTAVTPHVKHQPLQ